MLKNLKRFGSQNPKQNESKQKIAPAVTQKAEGIEKNDMKGIKKKLQKRGANDRKDAKSVVTSIH